MSTTENEAPSCANCGEKEHGDVKLKRCTACKMTEYCSKDCQIAHRPTHKKECKKRAAELHDELLFKEPPKKDDCPICSFPLPEDEVGRGEQYWPCCGNISCSGCEYVQKGKALSLSSVRAVCPFCKTPQPFESMDIKELLYKRMELGDAEAIHIVGIWHSNGAENMGIEKDMVKAVELWHRAAELGSNKSKRSLGRAYSYGNGVVKNVKKGRHYYEVAAMAGCYRARHSLGVFEAEAGNIDRAVRHYHIACRGGCSTSLRNIEIYLKNGLGATINDYEKGLELYQQHLSEIRSDKRDEAAAYSEEYKYLHHDDGNETPLKLKRSFKGGKLKWKPRK